MLIDGAGASRPRFFWWIVVGWEAAGRPVGGRVSGSGGWRYRGRSIRRARSSNDPFGENTAPIGVTVT